MLTIIAVTWPRGAGKAEPQREKTDRVSDQAVCATTEDSLRLGILYWKQKTLNSCTADLRLFTQRASEDPAHPVCAG